MYRHRLNKVLNDFIRNEGVAEVEFCDIGLQIDQLARILSNCCETPQVVGVHTLPSATSRKL
jgi:hypothetical protein